MINFDDSFQVSLESWNLSANSFSGFVDLLDLIALRILDFLVVYNCTYVGIDGCTCADGLKFSCLMRLILEWKHVLFCGIAQKNCAPLGS